ncbi:MAG: hypothetical protein RL497_2487 [Pseudomonadota bacterium]|jgi:thiamine biosynthesis lipoprotein
MTIALSCAPSANTASANTASANVASPNTAAAPLHTSEKPAECTQAEPLRYSFGAMTTRCELQFYGVTPAVGLSLAQAIEARVAGLVERFNFHAPGSWLNRTINNRTFNRVPIDAESASILACVHEHSLNTQGAFDITVGTLAERLKRARTVAEVEMVQKHLAPYRGIECWWLEARHLCFDNSITRIDLGGVIKEYAVDVSAQMARAAGVSGALINYGGDLYALGRKPDGARFVSAVVNPLAPERLLFGLDLEDQSLTTSAHYARNRLLKATAKHPAQRLSHIVDRLDAAGRDTRWISATVVSGSTLVSGIYSTALLLHADLPLPEGVTAVVVDAAGLIHNRIGASPDT